jgi:signal transduction histidine kinase
VATTPAPWRRLGAHPETRFYNGRAIAYLTVALVLSLGAIPVLAAEWASVEMLHVSLDSAAAGLALVSGLMALVRYYTRRTDTFLLVGIGLTGAGMLDVFHVVAATEWYAQWRGVDAAQSAAWTWTASRFFLGVMLSAAFVAGRVHERGGGPDERLAYALSAGFLVAGLLVLVMGWFPPAFFGPTLLGRPQELVPAVLFAVALGTFLSTGRWEWDDFEHWLVLSLIVAVIGDALYMPFSQALSDPPFDVAHVLKVLSYAFVFAGLLANMSRLFRQAERASDLLAEQNEELIRSNRELEQFSYAISHDLQEPLRVISGYTQLLGRRYRGTLDADADEFIDFTVEATERMRDHINGLLEYSRVGRTSRQVQEVALDQVLEQSERVLRQAVAESGATVTADRLPAVRGNPRLLERLFVNLIGNAIKYRRAEVAPRVHVSARAVGEHWELRFADNGIGIEPEYQDRIFGLFQRLHTREEYAGSGIGLALCRRIAEAHGGEIWVRSDPGEGSTFYVTLRREANGARSHDG